MKKFSSLLLLLAVAVLSCQRGNYASKKDADAIKVIRQNEVERIERTLAADDMQGRRTGTPGIEKAADFISDEFKKIGLQTLNSQPAFRQSFVMVRPGPATASAIFDKQQIEAQNILAITSSTDLKINNQSGFEKVYIKAGAVLNTEAAKFVQARKNYIVIVDTSFTKTFPRLSGLRRQFFKSETSVVFVLSHVDPTVYNISATQEIAETPLSNVVGMIPGRVKKMST